MRGNFDGRLLVALSIVSITCFYYPYANAVDLSGDTGGDLVNQATAVGSSGGDSEPRTIPTPSLNDSTKLRPITVTTVAPGLTQGRIPTDAVSFVANMTNQCATTGETRNFCFVTYMVTAAGGGRYNLTYPPAGQALQCPDGYVVAASLNNYAVDASGTRVLHYAGIDYRYITQDQYTAIASVRSTFNCEYESNNSGSICSFPDYGFGFPIPIPCAADWAPPNTRYSACVQSGCSAFAPDYATYTASNGVNYATIKVSLDPQGFLASNHNQTWLRTTFKEGASMCNPIDGAPSAWTADWPWEYYAYAYMHCWRDSGWYLPVSGDTTMVADSQYAPSAYICQKLSMTWGETTP